MMVDLKNKVHIELLDWVVNSEKTIVVKLLVAILHTELRDRKETM